MTIRKINRDFLNDQGHLNEENIALYLDALSLDKVEKLPVPVLEHVEDCMDCKTDIIDLFEIMRKNSENTINRKHPYFDRVVWGSSRQLMKLAAIFLGFIAIAVSIHYLLDYQKGYQQLYAQNFTPYDDVVTDRGSITSEYNTMFYLIMTDYYNKGNYDSSNFLFSSLYSINKTNDSLLFYYGVSCLASGDNTKAIQLLKELSTVDNSIFYHQSRWYLALSYLNAAANSKGKEQREMLSNSEKVLQELIDNNSPYTEKARVLLSKY